MSWNYRLMRWGEGEDQVVAIHEVHYDDEGAVTGWTEDPVALCADHASDMLGVLVMAAGACERPVLDAKTGEPIADA